MNLGTAEAARLWEYLLRGGFLHADDFWSVDELQNFQSEMRKVFADRVMEQLPLDHEILNTFFDLDSCHANSKHQQRIAGGWRTGAHRGWEKIEAGEETQRHKGTEARRERRDEIVTTGVFFVPLCLCVSLSVSISHLFSAP
jgi:hypothetical protein